MTEYDVLVIGSGSGATIAERALREGLKVAIIDRGPLGGTCMNVGCVPSKMLIFPADRVMEIRESGMLGVDAHIDGIDFADIMERMRRGVRNRRRAFERNLHSADHLTVYESDARFVDERTLEVEGKRVRGQKVFVVSGARPVVPPIDGLDSVDYLTNESVLELEKRPESVVIVGGGYIGVEYAHFLSAMGVEVTLIEMGDRLVPAEERSASELLERRLSERMTVLTNTTVTSIGRDKDGIIARSESEGGEEGTHRATHLMLAVGRRSNADILDVEKGGIETDERGYIKVNDRLETSAERVWSFGDAIGRAMFTHAANREAVIAWYNATHDEPIEMDYSSVPHAVFSWPQIASVGLTELEARENGLDYLVGELGYSAVTKGEAMRASDGFAKALVERGTRRVVGFHIAGPYAPILIQEVVDVMADRGTVDDITTAIHIHPALPELIVDALESLTEPE